jgi:hypothetical protein
MHPKTHACGLCYRRVRQGRVIRDGFSGVFWVLPTQDEGRKKYHRSYLTFRAQLRRISHVDDYLARTPLYCFAFCAIQSLHSSDNCLEARKAHRSGSQPV